MFDPVIGAGRTSMRYRARRDEERPLREKLRALAQQRRPFGYRLHVQLREEITIHRKKRQRLCRRERHGIAAFPFDKKLA